MAEKDDEKKSIFEKAGDLFSNRDEKAAAEEAKKRAEAAEAKAKELEDKVKRQEIKDKLDDMRADTAKRLEEEKHKADELKRKTEATRTDVQERWKDQVEAAKAKIAAQPKYIGEHTVAKGETLSHIALKYYNSAGEAYWRHIYEANKATIGDNPGMIRTGSVLKIPELPEELKK